MKLQLLNNVWSLYIKLRDFSVGILILCESKNIEERVYIKLRDFSVGILILCDSKNIEERVYSE